VDCDGWSVTKNVHPVDALFPRREYVAVAVRRRKALDGEAIAGR
jgi:hypothetical protein